jgi:hypothetical protein
MQVIAQLRHDALNLDHSRICYRSTFAVPTTELINFKHSFAVFASSPILNLLRYDEKIRLNVWPSTFEYVDQKYNNVNISIVEIDCMNFFSPKDFGPLTGIIS